MRTLTTQDVHEVVNAMAREMYGQDTETQIIDGGDFVSVGDTLLQSGTENVLNALSLVLGRTFVAVRPYDAKFKIINAINSGAYSNRMRKISYLSRPALPTGASNTQLYTNLKDGFTNGQNTQADPLSAKSQWEQHPPKPVEFNFGGSSEWQESTTVYEYQLKQAFRSEEEFARFVEGYMLVKANDIEAHKEAFNRLALLNFISGNLMYEMPGSVEMGLHGGRIINLVKGFNDEFGTNYTRQDLLTTHFTEFLEYFVSVVKTVSEELTYNTVTDHFPIEDEDGNVLLRHTPKDKQKMLMLADFWHNAEARVMPQIFNDEYLKVDNFEKVLYWQNYNAPSQIKFQPSIILPSNASGKPEQIPAEYSISNDYVLGIIYDEDALMTDYQLESALSTEVEARKRYRNIWWTFRQNLINDFTEKCVIFTMADTTFDD